VQQIAAITTTGAQAERLHPARILKVAEYCSGFDGQARKQRRGDVVSRIAVSTSRQGIFRARDNVLEGLLVRGA